MIVVVIVMIQVGFLVVQFVLRLGQDVMMVRSRRDGVNWYGYGRQNGVSILVVLQGAVVRVGVLVVVATVVADHQTVAPDYQSAEYPEYLED